MYRRRPEAQRAGRVCAVPTFPLCYLISVIPNSLVSGTIFPDLLPAPDIAGRGSLCLVNLTKPLTVFLESHPFIYKPSCCEAGSLRVLCELFIGFSMLTMERLTILNHVRVFHLVTLVQRYLYIVPVWTSCTFFFLPGCSS